MGHSTVMQFLVRWLAAPLLAVVPGTAQAQIGFPPEAIEAHRISGPSSVEVDGQAGLGGVGIRVTISPTGEVVAASVDPDSARGDVNSAPALAAVRQWKFRPFLYRDKPVTAIGTARVGYRSKGVWAQPGAAFPPVDYGSLRIELVRTACYGNCPDYSVVIEGDGNVTFSNRELLSPGMRGGVLVPGIQRTKIDRAAVEALVEKFRAARFFGLKKAYFYSVTDHPSYGLRFSTGPHSMEVTDYVGIAADMPWAVRELEDAVDAAAGTARWIKGDAGTVESLMARGLDIRGAEAQRLALAAVRTPGEQVVLDLIAAGLPLDAVVAPQPGARPEPLGLLLLRGSVRGSMTRLFAALNARGWLARLPRGELDTLFAMTGGGCNSTIAWALVGAGANVNARGPKAPPGSDDPFDGGRTALIEATNTTGGACLQTKDRGPVVAALLALGADPNAADDRGETALFGLEDVELQELLLKAGARADVRDREGRSPVFSSWTDVIVLRLLDAGADPRGYYPYGNRTLRQMSHERGMPAVRAWLDAHQIP